jgi:hypothetical protein
MPATPTPLLPAPLELELNQLHDEMMLQTDAAAARAHHSQRLAEIITNHIKRATVQVTTAGSATTQTGTGTIL